MSDYDSYEDPTPAHEDPYVPEHHDNAIGDPIGQPIYEPGHYEPGHADPGYLPEEYQPSHYNETSYEEPAGHAPAPDHDAPDYHDEEQPPAYAGDSAGYPAQSGGEGFGHADGATQYPADSGQAPTHDGGQPPAYEGGQEQAPEYTADTGDTASQPSGGAQPAGGTSTSSLSH